MAGDAAAIESEWDAVGFSWASLDENRGLAEIGRVVGAAGGVAGHDAEAFGGSDGGADAGAVAWGGGVVGAGVVCVVRGHALEGEEVELPVVADAVGRGGPVAGVVGGFVAGCGEARGGSGVGCHGAGEG